MADEFAQFIVDKKTDSTDEFDQFIVDRPKKEIVSEPEQPSIAKKALNVAGASLASRGIDPSKISQGPLISMAEKIAQSFYSNAKEQLLESPVVKEFNQRFSDKKLAITNPIQNVFTPFDAGAKVAIDALSNVSQRDVAKASESLGLDTAVFSIVGSGIKLKDLSKDFLKTKPFASNEALLDDLFKLNHKILQSTARVLQRKASNEAVRETARIITKSNNPVEAKIGIEGATKALFDERNLLLADNNANVNIRHTRELKRYLDSSLSIKELTPAQRVSADKLLQEASAEINSLGGKIDRLTAQKLKEKYQDLAQYEKSPDAHIRGTAIAARKVASSLKGMVLDGLPKEVSNRVQSINSRYNGLRESLDIFTILEEQFKVNPSKFSSGIHNYFTQVIGRRGVGNMVGAAIRFAPKIVGKGSFRTETARIEALKNEYMATKSIIENRFNQSMKSSDIGQRILTSDVITKKLLNNRLFDQKLLPAPEVKFVERGFTSGDPSRFFGDRLLPAPKFIGPVRDIVPAGRVGQARIKPKNKLPREKTALDEKVRRALANRRIIKQS